MGAIIVMDELVKSFKTIALMGKPRRDINLQMHKNYDCSQVQTS